MSFWRPSPPQPSEPESIPLALAKLYDPQAAEPIPACPECGGFHGRACPRVKRKAYNAQGKIVEVEYWPWGQWPTTDIIWPEQVREALMLAKLQAAE